MHKTLIVITNILLYSYVCMSKLKKTKIFCYFKQSKFTARRVARLFLLRKRQTFSYQLKECRHMCLTQRNVVLKIVLKYNHFILVTALYCKHIFKKETFPKVSVCLILPSNLFCLAFSSSFGREFSYL